MEDFGPRLCGRLFVFIINLNNIIMLMTIISYFVVVIVVLLLGSLIAFIVTMPLVFFKKIIGQSPILFLSGAVEGLASIWIGIMILDFFNKDAGIILMIITLIIFIFKYKKSKPVEISKEVKDIVGEDASDMDTPILIGNIVGLIIGCVLFIY